MIRYHKIKILSTNKRSYLHSRRSRSGYLVLRYSVFLFIISVIFILHSVISFAIGVSPSDIDLGIVSPGGYSESRVLVSTASEDPLMVSVLSGTLSGINISPSSFNISRKHPLFVRVSYSPPPDAAPGAYDGAIVLRASRLSSLNSDKISSVVESMIVPYNYTIISDAKVSCVVGGVKLLPAEPGSRSAISYYIKNTGTARVRPISSLSGFGSWSDDEVLPTTSQEYVHDFRVDKSPGNYSLILSVEPCGYEELLNLEVKSPGSLGRSGSLESLTATPKDGFLPLKASFKNTGDSPVNARLEGVLLDNEGKVVGVIKSDPLLVLPGKSVLLHDLISLPQEASVVRAKVVYEGSSSDEKIININNISVSQDGAFEDGGPDYIIMTMALLVFFILIMIIRKFLLAHRR